MGLLISFIFVLDIPICIRGNKTTYQKYVYTRIITARARICMAEPGHKNLSLIVVLCYRLLESSGGDRLAVMSS